MRSVTSPLVAAVTGAVVSAIVVGGVAIAQTGASGFITACVAEKSGNVRIVNSASECKANETTTSWNQQGPQGLPGADGADGISGWARVEGEWRTQSPNSIGYASATCPDGKRPLGGGYFTDFFAGTTDYFLVPIASEPSEDGRTWLVQVVNRTDRALGYKAYVICATVT